jgi:hypothetical protein
MTGILDILPGNKFSRIQKAYIVARRLAKFISWV